MLFFFSCFTYWKGNSETQKNMTYRKPLLIIQMKHWKAHLNPPIKRIILQKKNDELTLVFIKNGIKCLNIIAKSHYFITIIINISLPFIVLTLNNIFSGQVCFTSLPSLSIHLTNCFKKRCRCWLTPSYFSPCAVGYRQAPRSWHLRETTQKPVRALNLTSSSTHL